MSAILENAARRYQEGIDTTQAGLATQQGLFNTAFGSIMPWLDNNRAAVEGPANWTMERVEAPTVNAPTITAPTFTPGAITPTAGLLGGLTSAGQWMTGQAQQLATESGLAGTALTDRLVDRASQVNTAELADRYRRTAAADYERSQAQARAQLERANASRGLNPGSAGSMAVDRQMAQLSAAGRAKAMTDAGYQAEARRDEIEAMALAANAQRAETGRGLGALGAQYSQVSAGLDQAAMGVNADLQNTAMNANVSAWNTSATSNTSLWNSAADNYVSMWDTAANVNADAPRQALFQAEANLLPITSIVEMIDALDSNILAAYGQVGTAHQNTGGAYNTAFANNSLASNQRRELDMNMIDMALDFMTPSGASGASSGLSSLFS